MNLFETFSEYVEYSPRLVSNKTVAWFVNEALQQDHFVDAGEWMLDAMVQNKVILLSDNNTYRFANRITAARREAMERVPKMLTAWYLRIEEPISQQDDLPMIDKGQLVSVIMAFDRLVI